jgi:hypothetical protein
LNGRLADLPEATPSREMVQAAEQAFVETHCGVAIFILTDGP